MIIDVRKKVTPLDAAKIESKEVQKQFLKLAKMMSGWVDKYHAKVPYNKEKK